MARGLQIHLGVTTRTITSFRVTRSSVAMALAVLHCLNARQTLILTRSCKLQRMKNRNLKKTRLHHPLYQAHLKPIQTSSLIHLGCKNVAPFFASTGQCIDATDNSELTEFSVCAPYNSQVCCETTTMCEEVYEGTTPLEPSTPEQTSIYHCGEYHSTGSLTGCYGVDSKLVPNAVSCAAAGYPTQCCRALNFCGDAPTEHTPMASFDYCSQVPLEQQGSCRVCIQEGGALPDSEGKLVPRDTIYTAVGCIHVDEQGLAADLIRLLLGISGGVALLSILAGAFIFTTSQGESNRVKQAKELVTAAVSGLLFIIFVVIILDFIGVRVLQIPGLG